MDTIIGIKGQDFVLLLADRSAARSIVAFKHDEDKLFQIDRTKVMGMTGPVGDRSAFGEYVQKNITLYTLRTGLVLNTSATAAWIRNQLADAIRQGPYQVNALLAGYDNIGDFQGPQLYFMDYMGSSHPVDIGAQGYAANFTYSILDRHWHKDITQSEAEDVLRKCIQELRERFLINLPEFLVKRITKDGIEVVNL